jgi:hypothetical protein
MFPLTPKNRVLIDNINLLIKLAEYKNIEPILKKISDMNDVSKQSKKYMIDKINYFVEKNYIKFKNNKNE